MVWRKFNCGWCRCCRCCRCSNRRRKVRDSRRLKRVCVGSYGQILTRMLMILCIRICLDGERTGGTRGFYILAQRFCRRLLGSTVGEWGLEGGMLLNIRTLSSKLCLLNVIMRRLVIRISVLGSWVGVRLRMDLVWWRHFHWRFHKGVSVVNSHIGSIQAQAHPWIHIEHFAGALSYIMRPANGSRSSAEDDKPFNSSL